MKAYSRILTLFLLLAAISFSACKKENIKRCTLAPNLEIKSVDELDTIYVEVSTDTCAYIYEGANLEFHGIGIVMPLGFEPDGDGSFDFYGPVVACGVDSFQMDIIDKCENIIFTTLDPDDAWDGVDEKNKFFRDGGYLIQVTAVMSNAVKVEWEETINLARE